MTEFTAAEMLEFKQTLVRAQFNVPMLFVALRRYDATLRLATLVGQDNGSTEDAEAWALALYEHEKLGPALDRLSIMSEAELDLYATGEVLESEALAKQYGITRQSSYLINVVMGFA